jgi:hypothetical protein
VLENATFPAYFREITAHNELRIAAAGGMKVKRVDFCAAAAIHLN